MTSPLVFDRVAARYDATRGGERRGAGTVEEIEPWLVPGRLVEVGVGTGVVAKALRDRGHSVVGVDLSHAMLAIAAGRLGTGRLVRADARALPVADASVSTVVFVAALHVVGDIPAALREAARVLRPGGRVVAVHGGSEEEPNDVTEAMSSLDPLRLGRVDIAATVHSAAEAAGFAPVWSGPTRWSSHTVSPREIAESVRNRLWSYLWTVGDRQWRELVEPVIAAVEALPDPDRKREFVQRHRLTVLSR